MGLQGDLSTLDLTGLFQNLEGARKSGTLTITDGEEETQLYFHEGRLTLIAFPNRPGLIDYLVCAGALSAKQVEEAKARRRRGRSLGETLVESGAFTQQRFAQMALGRLTDEACEFLVAGVGRFEFVEGTVPRGVFDPEERALGLALSAGPLLLEAARRHDHWKMIRERIPSDSTHYVLARPPRAKENPREAQMLARLSELLDGTRSVSEVIAAFPHERFDAYRLLAELAEGQAIRLAASTDLNRMVQELARYDKKRAWSLLERGLTANPHNLSLLCTKVLLAEKLGDLEQASEALKLVVHLRLEAGESEAARDDLGRLKDLKSDDPFAWEKSFELALEEGRKADALADAKKLIALYKKPGLHKKVVSVLERLIGSQGSSWELVRELSRARVEAGEPREAVKGLEKFGVSLIARESYPLARKVYEEVLAIDPHSERTQETLADIKSGELARRRDFWRKVRRRALLGFLLIVVLPWIGYEALARHAYVDTMRAIVREDLLQSAGHAEALERMEELRAHYPGTTTTLFEVDGMVEELRAKVASEASAGT